jgi:hypothetical protein
MTDQDFARLLELCDKMDRIAEATGRGHTSTADLTPAERAEYQRIYDAAGEELEAERQSIPQRLFA